jgi:magnesium transporter
MKTLRKIKVPLIKKKPQKKAGAAPGTLVYIGEDRNQKIKIQMMAYDQNGIEEKELSNIEECFPYKDKPLTTWINIYGLNDISLIEKIGTNFNIHPLVLEDILNTHQRPKLDDYEDYIYLVFRMVSCINEGNDIDNEQVSVIIGKNYIISFQEKEGDVFDPIRERLRAGKGRIRKAGTDYLAYALMDAIVDGYFIVLDSLGEKIETLEDKLIADPQPDDLQQIHELRRLMITLRKSIWPLREVINSMLRGDIELIQKETDIFLRDVYDHTIQIIDTIESYRDVISGMLDTYLSSLSYKMNEVMKVLTIIATIFIPLTFVAGVYGMNFHHMPELEWEWVYPIGFWILMALVAGTMLIYFRKKKWI